MRAEGWARGYHFGRSPPPRALAPSRSPPPSQIVLAILGLYATVYGMVKIKGMLTSKPVPKKEAPKALASKTSGLGVSFEVKGGEGASVTSAKWGEASPARLSTAPTAPFPPPPPHRRPPLVPPIEPAPPPPLPQASSSRRRRTLTSGSRTRRTGRRGRRGSTAQSSRSGRTATGLPGDARLVGPRRLALLGTPSRVPSASREGASSRFHCVCVAACEIDRPPCSLMPPAPLRCPLLSCVKTYVSGAQHRSLKS